jgi:hypothetical protein
LTPGHHLREEADQAQNAIDQDGAHLPLAGRGEDESQPQAGGEEEADECLAVPVLHPSSSTIRDK